MMIDILIFLTLLYIVGIIYDNQVQDNLFIGGILPFIGYKTRVYGPTEFRAFWFAWFKKGIAFNGKIIPRK